MTALIRAFLIVVVALTGPFWPGRADAQSERRTFIRDAEIEDTIRVYTRPIFLAAGLNPSSVGVYIIRDDSINAFVAGGQRIFIHTGLLQASDDPLGLVGVMAHEAGHIAGGHLSRLRDQLRTASIQSIVSVIAGIGAAVATGDSRAAGAVIGGGQTAAQRNFLSYNRSQESAADAAAFAYLDEAGLSARGLRDILLKLEGQEILIGVTQNPYVRSHPIGRTRIAALETHMARSPYSDAPIPAEWIERHARMVAKLDGFLNPPAQTFRKYEPIADTVPGTYALAIALHRDGRDEEALDRIGSLIDRMPEDPYFHELNGFVLLERGRFEAAIAPYAEAARLAPDQPLILTGYGEALIAAAPDGGNDPAAETVLKDAVTRDPDQLRAWRLLATIHGRRGDIGNASLATAERYLRAGRRSDARRQAQRALDLLPAGSVGQQRALDILNAAEPRN